ncbi:uncharacterized protein LOC110737458 [Chenopodium quinoa]|uniref:uncharacterized protein LOC110735339 n=1 Tax=Chenopodium quinoa TaxID=63459 RepID=UPI000B789A85|nr:uncharacterized protein LOC110735339 [Chenopodium quinoa]XP_021773508.1 uncharacterized protein LOC110737456 [Chenopodium quinoa]XP_021773510.1 uncharacterized protein LOC110737458 [Chenopodium quinoa]
MSDLPWLVVGDFNQILFEAEKKGGAPRAQREMDDFREALDYYGLQDLGYNGELFTWWNKQADPDGICERLDIAVASVDWITSISHVAVFSLPRDRLKNVLQLFRSGTRRSLGIYRRKLKKARERLAYLDNCAPTERVVEVRKRVSNNLDDLLHLEEIMWRQRSRILSLSDGDQNTNSFHIKASRRRKRNFIKGVYDEKMVWKTNPDEVQSVAQGYFQNLFTSIRPEFYEETIAGVQGE